MSNDRWAENPLLEDLGVVLTRHGVHLSEALRQEVYAAIVEYDDFLQDAWGLKEE